MYWIAALKRLIGLWPDQSLDEYVKPVEDHWYWSKDTVKRIQRDEIEKP